MNDYQEALLSVPAKYRSFAYRAETGILLNAHRVMTLEQYSEVLHRLRGIVEREPLLAEDCTTPGMKNTAATWGLCNDSAELYPSADLHTFPEDFDDRGRVSQIRTPRCCPMRADTRHDPNREQRAGCFYDCRIFQSKHKTPSRSEAIRLIASELQVIESAGQKESGE